jgi:hypothetical protein
LLRSLPVTGVTHDKTGALPYLNIESTGLRSLRNLAGGKIRSWVRNGLRPQRSKPAG